MHGPFQFESIIVRRISSFQQPINDIDNVDPIIRSEPEAVQSEYGFAEVVINLLQWTELPVPGGLGHHAQRHLIILRAPVVRNCEIHFIIPVAADTDYRIPATELDCVS